MNRGMRLWPPSSARPGDAYQRRDLGILGGRLGKPGAVTPAPTFTVPLVMSSLRYVSYISVQGGITSLLHKITLVLSLRPKLTGSE